MRKTDTTKMKKNIQISLICFVLLVPFTSCLKDTKDNITFEKQQIPNINTYMPEKLLNAFGDISLYFGDNPPVIEGAYLADAMIRSYVNLDENSPFIHNEPATAPIPGEKRHFYFLNQEEGFLDYAYCMPKGTETESILYCDTTNSLYGYSYLEAHPDLFDTSKNPFLGTYFKDLKNHEVLQKVYVMGNDPFFTAYFYELGDYQTPDGNYNALNAVIISGKLEMREEPIVDENGSIIGTVIKPVLCNFLWGIETINNINVPETIDPQQIPWPGDVQIFSQSEVRTFDE